ncbi:MAG: ribosomal protein S18-alanine N-acetyltransferase [Betaproteobacteria bacterium]|nr:ribosomal protein S18-alanine N-acetyltransferase [Betaproteobacteria bacterium]
MSAVLEQYPRLEPMTEADLGEVIAIESAVYSHPWTRGNFSDSLRAGYTCFNWRAGGALAGYFVLLMAAGEAHLLNLSIAPGWQRRGHGAALLREVVAMARQSGTRHLFLEVRPSNAAAHGLYSRFGFRQLAVRRGYYPAARGREDALLLTLSL